MQSRKKILIVFLLLFPTIIFNCSDPVSPIPDVDPELIGEWYKLDTVLIEHPSPEIWFYGIQINEDKKVKLLGIETGTGKVAIRQDSFRKIQKANHGKIVFEYYIEGMQVIENNFYKIENNKLTISDNHQYNVYTKTKLGEQIFEPVNSNLSVKIDSISYENNKIYRHTSAYISKKSPSEFLFKAEMNNHFLTIYINGFEGSGIYEIAFGNGELQVYSGDIAYIMISDSLRTGNITINQYDEINNICTGNFNFSTVLLGYPDGLKNELTEGIFSVPIYK